MNVNTHTPTNENIIKHSLNNINESMIQLKDRLNHEVELKDLFNINFSIGNYTFDFYAPSLKFGIQIDAYSYAYSNIFNFEKPKLLSIPHKQIKTLKVSDYQVLVDCDEIIRFIKNFKKSQGLKLYLSKSA